MWEKRVEGVVGVGRTPEGKIVVRENEFKKKKGEEVKTHTGDYTRKLFPKPTDWKKGEGFNTASFL